MVSSSTWDVFRVTYPDAVMVVLGRTLVRSLALPGGVTPLVCAAEGHSLPLGHLPLIDPSVHHRLRFAVPLFTSRVVLVELALFPGFWPVHVLHSLFAEPAKASVTCDVIPSFSTPSRFRSRCF